MINSNIKRGLKSLYAFFLADKIIGGYTHIKAKDHRVNMFEYHPELDKRKILYNNSPYNLGDHLGYIVATFMLERKGLSLDSWVKKKRHFKCVGSNAFSGFQNATIWGSGLGSIPTRPDRILHHHPLTRLDIRAVRGPLTREIMLKYGHRCPEVYGDPAILLPYIYQPKSVVTHDLLIIPQFSKEVEFREKYPDYYYASMNTNDYKSVIDAITSSRKVITSSLHAIILSDCYGVPSVLFRGLNKKVDFKYLDYYYSTRRRNIKIADSFEEALDMEPLPLPDLKPLQEDIIKTFPYDLWG